MGEGADHDGIPQIRAHPSRFLEDLFEPFGNAEGLQLDLQVGDHAARHLVVEVELVVFQRTADRLVLALGDEGELVRCLLHRAEIDLHFVPTPAAIPSEQLGRRVRGAVGDRRGRGVHDVDAVFDRLQRGIGSQAGQAVRVQLQGQLAADRLERRHQSCNPLRRQEPARILDEHPVDAEPDQLAGFAGVVGVGVHRAEAIDQAAHGMEPDSLGRADRNLEVADIIQGLVGRVVTHAVCRDALSGQLDHVVREELKGKEALTAMMHDEWRLGHP